MVGTKRSPRSTPTSVGTHVALLRGINVGGKNKLPMRELTAIFTALGASDVRTYIQSGNVVFSAPARLVGTFATRVTEAIAREHGLTVPVVLRTASELSKIAAAHPMEREATDPKHLHVAFLAEAPTRAALAQLQPDRSPPDRFVVRGRDIFLFFPNGVARTKLTNAWFDRTLGTTSTVRNWRTVGELVAMATGSR